MNAPLVSAAMDSTLACTASYEEIRSYAILRQLPGRRHGLAVLMSQGVAGWLEQWSTLPAPERLAPSVESGGPCILPAEASDTVVHLLANMTLIHMRQEVHA